MNSNENKYSWKINAVEEDEKITEQPKSAGQFLNKFNKFEPSNASKERIIRLLNTPVPPAEAPKFKHKRLPTDHGSSSPRPNKDSDAEMHGGADGSKKIISG